MDHDVKLIAPKSEKTRFKEETGWGSAGSPAPAFLKRGDAAVRFIELLCKWWAKRYPFELKQYVKEVKFLKTVLRNGTGMAPTNDFAQVGVIPTRIVALADQLVPNFWVEGGRDLWFKVFPDFASRTERLGRFGAGA